MCGRFALTSSVLDIKEHFALKQAAASLIPRYNIAPSQFVIIIKNNILEFATWGFNIANSSSIIINAKIETMLQKKYFHVLFKKQRCLIIANGFFEWKQIDNKKVPFYIQVKKQNMIGFAGVFNKDNCVILTTSVDYNKYKNAIHSRVPVIIDKANYKSWLDHKTSIDLLQNASLQISQEDFFMYPVSSQVNNPKFDNEMCIKPLD